MLICPRSLYPVCSYFFSALFTTSALQQKKALTVTRLFVCAQRQRINSIGEGDCEAMYWTCFVEALSVYERSLNDCIDVRKIYTAVLVTITWICAVCTTIVVLSGTEPHHPLPSYRSAYLCMYSHAHKMLRSGFRPSHSSCPSCLPILPILSSCHPSVSVHALRQGRPCPLL